jgi:hypothetical protein
VRTQATDIENRGEPGEEKYGPLLARAALHGRSPWLAPPEHIAILVAQEAASTCYVFGARSFVGYWPDPDGSAGVNHQQLIGYQRPPAEERGDFL